MFRRLWRTPWRRGVLAVATMAPLTAAGFVLWRASHARQDAAAEIRANAERPFRVIAVNGSAAAVEPIAASPAFRDIATYRESLVVTGRSGAYIYDRSGSLVRQYRAGIELPGVELGDSVVGVLAGSGEPEVFFATAGEGVLAFNGSAIRQILPEAAGLRTVTTLAITGSGRLLIGTPRDGVYTFDGKQLRPLDEALKTAHITAIAGGDDDLWIGTLSDGVYRHHAGQLEDLRAGLPDPQVVSILVDAGSAYVGTPLGVVEFRDGKRARALAEGFFARALTLQSETLVVATEDEGVVRVPLSGGRAAGRFAREAAEAPASVRRLKTIDGAVYGVGDTAVYRYDAGRRQWAPVLTAGPHVLADRNIAATAAIEGRLWVGYFDRGLDVVEAGFDRATHYEDDTLFCVNRIVADPEGRRTAVATANGLAIFDPAGRLRQVMGRKDGFLSDHVTDVAFRDGGMVVATPAGLSFVDRGGVRSLYAFHGLVNNHVYTVAATGTEVAVGTLGGLSMLERDAVRVNYTTANSRLKHNWITALIRVGQEWFAGTYGAGVLRLDASGEWQPFPDLKDGFIVNPNAMAAGGGRVYAGSLDRGLFVYDIASRRWTNTSAGLPSRNVTALAVADGRLYIGTDNGLVRVAEGALR